MKSFASSTSMKFDQELLDAVLYTFVRGGFFVRANEVVDMMEKGNMFIDKYKYRTLFLKYHKTLYKGKAPKFQTESQLQKREAGLTFKKSGSNRSRDMFLDPEKHLTGFGLGILICINWIESEIACLTYVAVNRGTNDDQDFLIKGFMKQLIAALGGWTFG
ncbi:hypothetical protein Pint_17061 [Pistacia integerrima]|uniref:Uncharacterized protein n=1 Tax=Pistacia integerrima TaxID=434235 RepID=A0ACC0ZEM4_9ROSI|nr:hypothetical protein Pint_17061 [Pistacia integerrima]